MLLNDLAWIMFIAPTGMVLAQFLLLAAAVRFDDGPGPGLSAVGRALFAGHRCWR